MRRIITEKEKRKIVNLAKNNFSRQKIAEMVGVGSATVDRLLRKLRIKTNGKVRSRHSNSDSKIIELHEQGIPCKEAAKMIPMNYGHYITRRNKLGLKYIPAKQTRKLTSKQKEILIGTLMGDGNMSKSGKGTRIETYMFNMGHSHKQYEYFDWKYSELELLGNIYCRVCNRGYWGLWASSKPYQNFNIYYKMFYKKGKKVITKSVLNKLTPLGVAVWFMDDGTTSDTYYICTQSFGKEGCEKIKTWFYNKYGIECTLNFPKDQDQPVIRIRANSRAKFTKLIKPYIIKSMQYKLIQ